MELIPFTAQYFPILASWFKSEADVVQWGGPLMHYPLDDVQLQALLNECTVTPPRRKCWMAEDAGKIVGHIELGFDWRNGDAIVQRVAINPEFRGCGLAEPMVRLAVKEAFAIPEIERLELNVFTFNTRAISVYSRIGFKQEGVRRSSTRVGNERWDGMIMAILRDEFQPFHN